MKKIIFILIIPVIANLLIGQNNEPKIKENFEKAYTDKASSLLISKSEFNCSFLITDKINEDIKIINAKHKILGKIYYSNEDEMYINKGSNDGIKEGDVFSVLERGKKIRHPFKHKTLGIFYKKKSLATVTCVYKDKAIIKLNAGCTPVSIGDFLIKHKQIPQIFDKRIDYKNCKLVKSDTNGTVVYYDQTTSLESRTMFGDDFMVSVDIGNAYLKRGDFLLFHKNLGKGLPPLIVGTGIVVSAQKTNSTVKILRTSFPINIGDNVTYLPRTKKIKIKNNENIPTIGSQQGNIEISKDDKVLELNIMFNLDESTISEANITNLDKVGEFIKDKSQYSIILKGYTCKIGRMEHNLKLSKTRVEIIKNYLMKKFSIDSALIESYFYGEKNCEFDNSTEASRRKNRRVAITLIGR